jgi:hypothetical protein
VLAEEITPTLESLRKERTAYIQWKSNEGEIERRARITVAHRYSRAEQTLANAAEAAAAHDEKADAIATRIREYVVVVVVVVWFLVFVVDSKILFLCRLEQKLSEQQKELENAVGEKKTAARVALSEAQALPALSTLVADDDNNNNADDENDDGAASSKKRKAGGKKAPVKSKRGKKQQKQENDDDDDDDNEAEEQADDNNTNDDDDDEVSTALASSDALRVLEARASALGKLLAKAEAALAHTRAAAKSEAAQRRALRFVVVVVVVS